MNKKEIFLLLIGFIIYLAIGSVIFLYFENGIVESSESLPRDIPGEAQEFWSGAYSENMTYEELLNLANGLRVISTGPLITNETIVHLRHWQFYDGFFFALTVITTIGYGHLAPKSAGGQIFCIIYALFGVPMTGILIAGFGNFFSGFLVRAHERSKSKHFNATRALVVNTTLYLIPGLIVFLFLPALAFTFLEDWSYLESFYFAFITLTTIGFGDYVAGINDDQMENRWIYQITITIWIIFGLGYWAMMYNFISKAMKSKPIQRINRTVGKGFRQTHRLISKEMEEFVRTMQHTKPHLHPKRSKKLKRTQSMPLMWRSSTVEINRSFSDSHLLKSKHKPDICTMQYEANTNTMGFIIQLARALAFGHLGEDDDEGHSCRSSLLEMLSESILQASRRGSAWEPDDSQTSLTAFYPLTRESVTRRSCDLLSAPQYQAMLDIPSGVKQLRRKSDSACYGDIPLWRSSCARVEELNEFDGSTSPLVDRTKNTTAIDLLSNEEKKFKFPPVRSVQNDEAPPKYTQTTEANYISDCPEVMFSRL